MGRPRNEHLVVQHVVVYCTGNAEDSQELLLRTPLATAYPSYIKQRSPFAKLNSVDFKLKLAVDSSIVKNMLSSVRLKETRQIDPINSTSVRLQKLKPSQIIQLLTPTFRLPTQICKVVQESEYSMAGYLGKNTLMIITYQDRKYKLNQLLAPTIGLPAQICKVVQEYSTAGHLG